MQSMNYYRYSNVTTTEPGNPIIEFVWNVHHGWFHPHYLSPTPCSLNLFYPFVHFLLHTIVGLSTTKEQSIIFVVIQHARFWVISFCRLTRIDVLLSMLNCSSVGQHSVKKSMSHALSVVSCSHSIFLLITIQLLLHQIAQQRHQMWVYGLAHNVMLFVFICRASLGILLDVPIRWPSLPARYRFIVPLSVFPTLMEGYYCSFKWYDPCW